MPHQVLLVDDSDTLLTTLADELSKRGFTTVSANNGKKALDYLVGVKPRPDCMVVDINMPVMNGNEFVRVIRSYVSFKNLPVVFISSQPIPQLDAYQPARFLPKPFTPDQLVEAIGQAIAAAPKAVQS